MFQWFMVLNMKEREERVKFYDHPCIRERS